MLASAIMNTLETAEKLQCRTLSIAEISQPLFSIPKVLSAKIFFITLRIFVAKAKEAKKNLFLEKVRLCNLDTETTAIFSKEFLR